MRGAMHVHEVDGACRTQYLGSVQLDQPSIALGLPPERLSYVVVSFEGSSFLGGSRTATSDARIWRIRVSLPRGVEIGRPEVVAHNAADVKGSKRCQRRGQLWPAIQGIGALPRFGLGVFADDGEALGLGKALNGRPLGFYAKARALLSLGRNSKICDRAFH